ncbi:P-loop containing nucleoside triphosphate hydrolase protein [Boletus edulis BED1]|uniref:P-loop containing nucleoside triphosphate hydrolase protein n=1 Tax=Boletus edulis BED1 TaxID=1328754 RepID=A0AAD4BDR0_BOLED|nr:P-loop containing nucleoside triphosphate hydrolase protein [Boletus edulis BED1]
MPRANAEHHIQDDRARHQAFHGPPQTNGGQQFKRDAKHTETIQGLPQVSVKRHVSVDSLHTRKEQQSQESPQADAKHTETGQGLLWASGKSVTVDPLHIRSEIAPRRPTIEGSPQTDTDHTATVQGVPQASGKPSVKVNTPPHPSTEQNFQIDGARPQAIQGSPQADTEHTEAAQGLLQASDKPSVTVDSSLHTGTGEKSQTDREHPQASRGSPQSQTNTEYIETTPGPQVPEEPFAMVDTKDLEADDIVIAVMGPTGTGKSTLVRLASGYDIRIGHELISCTKDILAIRFRDRESGRHIVLVDTPGFDDTYNSDLEILNLISDWLNSSYKKDKLLSGILYLHRISDNRMAGTPLKNLRVFQKLCGNDALDKVYLTTTMWDEVVLYEGERRLEELKAEYWKALIQQGAQVVCCRNDNDSATDIIQRIVTQEQDATRKAVLLQREMADLHRELKETEAGQELYTHLEALVERQMVLLKRISKEKKAASDASVLEDLEKEYDDLREQIDSRLRQMQGLRLSRPKIFFRKMKSIFST